MQTGNAWGRLLPEVGTPSELFDFASAGFHEDGWAGSGLGRTAAGMCTRAHAPVPVRYTLYLCGESDNLTGREVCGDGFAPLSLMPNHVKFAANAGDCCIFDLASTTAVTSTCIRE